MTSGPRTSGVSTGGDCPGLNAVEWNRWERMIALRGAKIRTALAEAIHPMRLVDPQNELLEVARAMGIGFGDMA